MPTPEFEPKRRHSERRRAVVGILGSLLWIVALLVVAIVSRRADTVELALTITSVSILMWSVLLWAGRIRRARREREPWSPSA